MVQLANESCRNRMRLHVWRKCAAEVSRLHFVATGIVTYQNAILIPAVYIAGEEVEVPVDEGEVSHTGQTTTLSDRVIHGPKAVNLRLLVLKDAFNTFDLYEYG